MSVNLVVFAITQKGSIYEKKMQKIQSLED